MKYVFLFLLASTLSNAIAQNGAADFNGAAEITVANGSAMITGTQEFSIETWVYLRNLNPQFPNFDGIVGWRNEFDHDFYLLQLSGTSIEARLRTSVGVYSISDTGISVNAWNHLALTYDGSILQLYINGRTSGSTSASGTFTDSTEVLHLGNLPFQVNNFSLNGSLDEVRIWRKARTASQINSMRFVEIVNPSAFTDLSGYYRLNDTIGSLFAREEISRRDGNVQNGVTFTNSTAPLFNGPIGFATRTICAGDSTLINGMWVKSAGNFRDTIMRPGMQDSLVFLEVKIANKPLIPGIVKSDPDSLACNIVATRYSWFRNGTLLSDSLRKIKFTISGNYRVVAYNAQCPSDTSPAFFFQASGVKNVLVENVKVFPSPANSRIFIASRNERIKYAVIIDQHGREVISLRPQTHTFSLNTKKMEAGVYFLRLESSTSTITRKILIQH